MANVQAQFVTVKRADQIIPGDYYMLLGTVSNAHMPEAYLKARKMGSTMPLPPTLVRPLSRVRYHSELDVGSFRVWFYVVPGEWMQGREKEGYGFVSEWDLTDINVPEHGRHDHHLVRIPDGWTAGITKIRERNRKNDYGEMVGYRAGKRGY